MEPQQQHAGHQPARAAGGQGDPRTSGSQHGTEVGKKDSPSPPPTVNSAGEGCKGRQEEAGLTGPQGQESGLYIEAHAGLCCQGGTPNSPPGTSFAAPASSRASKPGQKRSSANRQRLPGSTLGKQDSARHLWPALSLQLHKDKYLPTDSSCLMSIWGSAIQA